MTSIVAAFARQRLADMEELQHHLGRRRVPDSRPGTLRPERTARAAAVVRLSRRLSTSAGSGAS